jgi:hypothetical protein
MITVLSLLLSVCSTHAGSVSAVCISKRVWGPSDSDASGRPVSVGQLSLIHCGGYRLYIYVT